MGMDYILSYKTTKTQPLQRLRYSEYEATA